MYLKQIWTKGSVGAQQQIYPGGGGLPYETDGDARRLA